MIGLQALKEYNAKHLRMQVKSGIMTTLWKRHDLERIVLGYYSTLEVDSVCFTLLAVGSEGELSRAVAEDNGWNYIEFPNSPLGAKHNAAMEWFRDKDIDFLIYTGSDDLMNVKLIETMCNHYAAGEDSVSLEEFYILEDECYYAHRAFPGAGKMFSKKALRACNYQAWPADLERKLDGALTNVMISKGIYNKYIKDCREKGIVLLDVKTSENMWHIADLRNIWGDRFTKVDPAFLQKEFPGTWEKIHQLNMPKEA